MKNIKLIAFTLIALGSISGKMNASDLESLKEKWGKFVQCGSMDARISKGELFDGTKSYCTVPEETETTIGVRHFEAGIGNLFYPKKNDYGLAVKKETVNNKKSVPTFSIDNTFSIDKTKLTLGKYTSIYNEAIVTHLIDLLKKEGLFEGDTLRFQGLGETVSQDIYDALGLLNPDYRRKLINCRQHSHKPNSIIEISLKPQPKE